MMRLNDREEKLKNLLRKAAVDIGEIYFFDTVSSTMDIAFNLEDSEVKQKTIVLSRIQTQGRGRFNRKWHSGYGALYFSLVLTEYDYKVPYSMIAAHAVYKAFKKYTDCVCLKWINDVLWEKGKKIAGILTEEKRDRTVIGIGVNLNNRDFPSFLIDKATSYYLETGSRINNDAFTCSILEELFKLIDRSEGDGLTDVLTDWEGDSGIVDMKVRIVNGNEEFTGIVKGINKETGSLILAVQGEEREFYEGSIFYDSE